MQDPVVRVLDRPLAIQGHLAEIAEASVVVVVRSGPTGLFGTLGPPEALHRIPFSPLFPVTTPSVSFVGGALEVTYRAAPGLYRFHSQVLLAGDHEPWWLATPLRIDLVETRNSPRTPIAANGKVRLTLLHEGRAMPVRLGDASDTGISFRFDPRCMGLAPGDVVRGWVLVPGRGGADVHLKILHVDQPFGGHHEVLAGARFVRLGRTNQDKLRALIGLSARS